MSEAGKFPDISETNCQVLRRADVGEYHVSLGILRWCHWIGLVEVTLSEECHLAFLHTTININH